MSDLLIEDRPAGSKVFAPAVSVKRKDSVVDNERELMTAHTFTHLDALESESIHIMREVAAEGKNHALLFSGGKGTVVLKSETQSRNVFQSVTLLETIAEFGFDACMGGARRDEEKARAKERIFSFRDEFGQWHPRKQRPGPWCS